MNETVHSKKELFEELDSTYTYETTIMVKGVEFIVMETDKEKYYFLQTIDGDIYTTELENVRKDPSNPNLTVGNVKSTGQKVMLDDDGIHEYSKVV